MEGPYVLVDSDILIDVSRGISRAVTKLEELGHSHNLSVSVITQLELMIGCANKKEFEELSNFMERFDVFHISGTISKMAVELFEKYRLSHGVLIADMLIASTALVHNIELNFKESKRL